MSFFYELTANAQRLAKFIGQIRVEKEKGYEREVDQNQHINMAFSSLIRKTAFYKNNILDKFLFSSDFIQSELVQRMADSSSQNTPVVDHQVLADAKYLFELLSESSTTILIPIGAYAVRKKIKPNTIVKRVGSIRQRYELNIATTAKDPVVGSVSSTDYNMDVKTEPASNTQFAIPSDRRSIMQHFGNTAGPLPRLSPFVSPKSSRVKTSVGMKREKKMKKIKFERQDSDKKFFYGRDVGCIQEKSG